MKRAAIILAFLALGCAPETTRTPDLSYCGHNEGDAFCAEVDPAAPFCVGVSGACLEASGIDITHPNGCVSDMPAQECREACGVGNSDACLDPTVGEASSTSSGGETETSGTTVEPDTDTEEPSTTTGPECSEDMPCADEAAPFCVDGMCSTCDAVVEQTSDEACAELDSDLPLCVGTACVQCTAEDTSACGGETPLCDEENNTCVRCSFHEECEDLGLRACNIATGACFSGDAANVSEVNAGSNGAIQAAIGAVADGAEHTILLTGGGGNHTVTVDGGKTIAIVSDGSTERVVQGSTGNPTVTVTGAGSTVYLHRLALTLNGDDVGISAEASGVLYADSTRVAQNSGGGIELAAGTSGFLRNCMVGGAADAVTIDASSATVEFLYSSVLGGLGDADGFVCSSGINISIRNSIITTRGSTPALGCAGADVSNTAIENTGMTSWFSDYNGGDAHLEAAGQTEFADVAVWEQGDPPFDFDGDDRPNIDGATDFAGADAVP